MTELSPTTPAVAPVPVSTAAAPAVNNAPVGVAEAHVGGHFLSTLTQKLQALNPSNAVDLLTAATTAVQLQATSAETDTGTAKPSTDGSALPPDGQVLPLDPTLLGLLVGVMATPNTPAAAVTVGSGTQSGAPREPPGTLTTPAPISRGAQLTLPDTQGRPVDAMTVIGAATHSQDESPLTRAAVLTGESLPQPVSPSLAPLAPLVIAPIPEPTAPMNSTSAVLVAPPIEIPVARPGWDQALGQRVQWLVGQQLQGAELHINPPHLGPIEVRINIGQDQQTSVSFTSPHMVVREAIEAAMPRLRDMLGGNGLNLVDVNVSQHSFAEQRRQATPQGTLPAGYGNPLDGVTQDDRLGAATAVRTGLGLVDYFA